MMGSPAATWFPEWTKIWVMIPSTCGMITAVSRDFRVETYSVDTSTFSGFAVRTFTGIAWGGPAVVALPPPQPATSASAVRIADSEKNGYDGRKEDMSRLSVNYVFSRSCGESEAAASATRSHAAGQRAANHSSSFSCIG